MDGFSIENADMSLPLVSFRYFWQKTSLCPYLPSNWTRVKQTWGPKNCSSETLFIWSFFRHYEIIFIQKLKFIIKIKILPISVISTHLSRPIAPERTIRASSNFCHLKLHMFWALKPILRKFLRGTNFFYYC